MTEWSDQEIEVAVLLVKEALEDCEYDAKYIVRLALSAVPRVPEGVTKGLRDIVSFGAGYTPKQIIEDRPQTVTGLGGFDPYTRLAGAMANAQAVLNTYCKERDPRYWRDRDPAIIEKVRQGFRQLFPRPEGLR